VGIIELINSCDHARPSLLQQVLLQLKQTADTLLLSTTHGTAAASAIAAACYTAATGSR
jgi:hypothetical protein